MRDVDPVVQSRLDRGELVVRHYLWIGALDRQTGNLTARGYWTDNGQTLADIRRPDRSVVTRQYFGGVGLQSVSLPPLVTGMTAQPLQAEFGATADEVQALLTSWSIRRATVEVHEGYLNPMSMRLDQPADMIFQGFADEPEFSISGGDGVSVLSLSCAPHTQELLRASDRMRSDADQRRRNANDGGFRHVGKERRLEWGVD